MTEPVEPVPDPFWSDRSDGAQPATPESLGAWRAIMDDATPAPAVRMRRWLPGEDIGPEGFRREYQGTFTDVGTMDANGIIRLGAPEEYIQQARPEGVGVSLEDLYSAIREASSNQIVSFSVTPPAQVETPPAANTAPPANRAERRGQRNQCACGNWNNPGTHSSEQCHGETALQRHQRVFGPRGVPLADTENWYEFANSQVRIVGHDMERNMVNVEFTNDTPISRDGDPMTAIRTRPLAGGGAVGSGGGGGGTYARQSTTWAGTNGGAAGGGQVDAWGGAVVAGGRSAGRGRGGAGGFGGGAVAVPEGTFDTLRDRLLRHGVTEERCDICAGVGGHTPNCMHSPAQVTPPAPTEPRYLEPYMAQRAKAHMDEIFGELDTKSKGELLDLIRDMRKDWETLNDIHNRRANRSGWCTEYEDRQEHHNQRLTALKLIGRVSGGPSDEGDGRGL